MNRRSFLQAALSLGLAGSAAAQTWPPASPPAATVLATIGPPKDEPGYYVGTVPGYTYVTIYSPNLVLTSGRQFVATQTEPKTYRATLEGEYVWVYING